MRSSSGGDNAAEIVAVTRSDARASLTYSREAVVDNDADLLAAAAGEGGVDGNPAHEQLNDLASLGVREVRLQALTDLRQHIVRDGVVKRVIVGFEDSQPLIEGLEFPFHVCGDGVELVVGELGAGVEVDGALAAVLCCGAIGEQRGAFGLGYSLCALVTALGQQLVDEDLGIE